MKQQQSDPIDLIELTHTSVIVPNPINLIELTQTCVVVRKAKQVIKSRKEFADTIEIEKLNEKIISACEKTFKEMKQFQQEAQFCFKVQNFQDTRLKKDGVDISLKQFLSSQQKLEGFVKGNQNVGICHHRDQDDKYFGGDYVFKSVKFTTKQNRIKAYRELNLMNIVNNIENWGKYFVQLRCCFIERQPICVPKIVQYHFIFVIEFGRSSLGHMLQLKRQYTDYELLVILRQILEGGALLEEQQIAQNDYKPDNIILNRHLDQVKIIDFGVAMHVSKSKHPTLQLPLIWERGSVAYQSPQLVAAWLKQTEKGKCCLSIINEHCLEYCPTFPVPNSPHYSPFKNDVYSVAITICEIAGIDLEKEMLWCFYNRSEIEKKQLLESHIQDVDLVSILMNMLHNDEQQRCSFHQALQQTEGMRESTLQQDKESNYIKVAKLAFKDEQELQRSNQDNFDHFDKLLINSLAAGTFDYTLFYAEKSLIYAQGYPPQSDIRKLYALQNKGQCLIQLIRNKEAALVYQQALDHLKSIKGQFDNNENDYQVELGRCLHRLGIANYELDKYEEALRNCDDALTALRLNNQESWPRNEEIISNIYNLQALIFSDQNNFAAAKKKYQQYLQIAIKNNIIYDQATCYFNMCDLKVRQNELDEEALQFANNAIQIYTQAQNGQNNQEVLMSLFNKCIVQCVIESNAAYEQTLKLAFQIAMSVKGGGQMNKQYADYIKLRGSLCILQQYKIVMEMHPAFKNHAIQLFKEAQRVYNILNNKENEMLMLLQICWLQQ